MSAANREMSIEQTASDALEEIKIELVEEKDSEGVLNLLRTFFFKVCFISVSLFPFQFNKVISWHISQLKNRTTSLTNAIHRIISCVRVSFDIWMILDSAFYFSAAHHFDMMLHFSPDKNITIKNELASDQKKRESDW